MLDQIRNNPAAFIGALRGLALAALTCAVAFGLKISPEQQSAVLQLGGALTAVALLFSVLSSKVTVPKSPTADAPDKSIQNVPPPAPRG
jgi:ABC-type Co2+ transport system permease subunit